MKAATYVLCFLGTVLLALEAYWLKKPSPGAFIWPICAAIWVYGYYRRP